MTGTDTSGTSGAGPVDEFADCGDVVALLLDEHSNVRAFTRACARLFGLRPSDLGRSLPQLAAGVRGQGLAADVARSAGGEPVVREVFTAVGPRRCFRRRVTREVAAGVTRVVVTWSDATDGREAHERLEREILERADELRAIVDTAVDAIVTIDKRGSIDIFNAAAERLFGYTREEVHGRNVSLLMPDDVAAEHDGYVARFLETRVPHVIGIGREVVGRRKDGTTFPAELSLGHYDHERFAGFVRDLTLSKRLEAEKIQAQKLEVIGRLAAGVSHDFNNLLAGISGGLRMIRDRLDVGAEVGAMFEDVAREVQRGASLTRKLLDLGRTNDSLPCDVRPAELLERAERTYRGVIGEDVRFEVRCVDPTLTIRVDPDRFEHALLNLLINSRDALPDGGTVVLSCAARPPGADGCAFVVVSVADDGVGMDEETLRNATEAFFTTKEVGRGTGLGLASVKSFVEEHGGSLEIESRPGEGTTVGLVLPRGVGAPATDAPAVAAHTADGRGRHVLVVEDERLVRLGITHVLESAGYRVSAAADPDEALRLLEGASVPVDLVLSDVVLPGTSGPELARIVERRRPGTRVLLMSAFPATELVARGRIAPGTDTLEKPFLDEELCAKVHAVLARDAARPADSH
ncbi:MAG: PAS domain S-box protein [Planctomycetota bacterium]